MGDNLKFDLFFSICFFLLLASIYCSYKLRQCCQNLYFIYQEKLCVSFSGKCSEYIIVSYSSN